MAIPIFQDTMLAIVAAIIVAIAVAAAVTFILGFEENAAGADEGTAPVQTLAETAVGFADPAIEAVADARMFPLDQVKDEVFSQKMMGDGVAFDLQEDQVCAPVSGELTALFPTGHAFGIRGDDGVEVLVHIGIDTVKLNGKGFTVMAEQGQRIRAGQPVVSVDRELIRGVGYDITTVLIVTDANGKSVHFGGFGEVRKGDRIS